MVLRLYEPYNVYRIIKPYMLYISFRYTHYWVFLFKCCLNSCALFGY